jgi:hypothetical protein
LLDELALINRSNNFINRSTNPNAKPTGVMPGHAGASSGDIARVSNNARSQMHVNPYQIKEKTKKVPGRKAKRIQWCRNLTEKVRMCVHGACFV